MHSNPYSTLGFFWKATYKTATETDTKLSWQVLQEHGNQFASFVELINVKIPYGNVQAFHQQVWKIDCNMLQN